MHIVYHKSKHLASAYRKLRDSIQSEGTRYRLYLGT